MLELHFILLWIVVFFLCIAMYSVFQNNQRCRDTTENFKDKDTPSKEELQKSVSKLFDSLQAENNRHSAEIMKLKEQLEKVLKISLDPSVTLEAKRKKVKEEEICRFDISGQLSYIKQLYDTHKQDEKFELIHVYERPIKGQSKDFENKVKTYGYIYLDDPVYHPERPYYLQGRRARSEKYGNMTLRFDEHCRVVELVSLTE